MSIGKIVSSKSEYEISLTEVTQMIAERLGVPARQVKVHYKLHDTSNGDSQYPSYDVQKLEVIVQHDPVHVPPAASHIVFPPGVR